MASPNHKTCWSIGPILLFLLICVLNLAAVTSSTEEGVCSLAEDGTCQTEAANSSAMNETDDDNSSESAKEEIVNQEKRTEENKLPHFDEKQLVFPCIDEDEECDFLAFEGECVAKAESMIYRCSKSCDACSNLIDWDMGKPQRLISGHESRIWKRIIKARRYLNNYVAEDPVLSQSLPACLLDDPRCAFWAAQGECEKNPNYMRHKCGPMCESCEDTSVYTRCNIDYTEPNAWEKPGDMNNYFENMTTFEAFEKYEPKVWSRPSYVNGDTEETADYILGPWVVTLENFLSKEEADRLIELGRQRGYEISSEFGEYNADGTYESAVSERRTSKNAWCNRDCAEDPVAIAVMERMADVAGMSNDNSEYLQLLRYQEGEYYKSHHDLNPKGAQIMPGVRILTVFLYLNSVEEGGGTRFPELDITVEPRRGRVLIWPSVLDEAPHTADFRTTHEALPVTKGEKYGANGWFHQRNFKGPYHMGCAG